MNIHEIVETWERVAVETRAVPIRVEVGSVAFQRLRRLGDERDLEEGRHLWEDPPAPRFGSVPVVVVYDKGDEYCAAVYAPDAP